MSYQGVLLYVNDPRGVDNKFRPVTAEDLSGADTATKLIWFTPINDTVTTNNKEIIPATGSNRHFLICNLDLKNHIYLNTDAPASPAGAIAIVQPGQTLVLESDGNSQINVFASSGTINYTYKIGVYQ